MKGIFLAAGFAMLLASCGTGQDPVADPADATSPAAQDELALAPEDVVIPVGSPSTVIGPSPETSTLAPASASLKPRIPVFNAVCGQGIEVHANEGGPVFIDGEETNLKKFNENYFEASHEGITISISFRPDGSLSLTFSGPNRANGICTLK